MNKIILDRLEADFTKAFENIALAVENAVQDINDETHSRMMDRRIKDAMRKSREGYTLDTSNDFDGDMGRDHRDYMEGK